MDKTTSSGVAATSEQGNAQSGGGSDAAQNATEEVAAFGSARWARAASIVDLVSVLEKAAKPCWEVSRPGRSPDLAEAQKNCSLSNSRKSGAGESAVGAKDSPSSVPDSHASVVGEEVSTATVCTVVREVRSRLSGLGGASSREPTDGVSLSEQSERALARFHNATPDAAARQAHELVEAGGVVALVSLLRKVVAAPTDEFPVEGGEDTVANLANLRVDAAWALCNLAGAPSKTPQLFLAELLGTTTSSSLDHGLAQRQHVGRSARRDVAHCKHNLAPQLQEVRFRNAGQVEREPVYNPRHDAPPDVRAHVHEAIAGLQTRRTASVTTPDGGKNLKCRPVVVCSLRVHNTQSSPSLLPPPYVSCVTSAVLRPIGFRRRVFQEIVQRT